MDPCWNLQPVACMVNMEFEIRIMSLSRDNSHSLVRISHGSNKFVMDLKTTTQKFLNNSSKNMRYNWMRKILCADQRQKQNHEEENLLALHQESFPWKEGIGSILKQGKHSLSEYEVSKKVIHLLRLSQTVQREDDGAIQFWRIKENLQSQFPQSIIGLMLDGKHAWQQEEGQKGNFSTVLMIQEQFISELFKDLQNAIFVILHCRTML